MFYPFTLNFISFNSEGFFYGTTTESGMKTCEAAKLNQTAGGCVSSPYASITDTCTRLYPAASESPSWRDICRSATVATPSSLLGSRTSVVAVSVTSARTRWACCRAVWSQPHWPGSRGRSRTWNVLWRRPRLSAQLLRLLLWGYLEETMHMNVLYHLSKSGRFYIFINSWQSDRI